MENKIIKLLGFALKAGKLRVGQTIGEDLIRKKKAKMCILALDTAENTVEKFKALCKSNHIPLISISDKQTLGKFLKKDEAAVILITSDDFKKGILSYVNDRGVLDE